MNRVNRVLYHPSVTLNYTKDYFVTVGGRTV